MKRIPLTQGYHATVDDADHAFLAQWKWHAFFGSSGNVYACRNSDWVNGKRGHIMMHSVLCPAPRGMETDHRNGDGLDNRRGNLRVATRAQNMHNRKPNAGGTSRFKGVHWHKQHEKWCASIQVNKKRYHVGLFESEQAAALAYEQRAQKEFKEFFRSHLS